MVKPSLKTLEAEIKRLKHLAYKDELTGLFNRRGFKEEAEKFLHEMEMTKKSPDLRQSVFIKNFSLIVIDADHFKHVNDTYGHDIGDLALKMIAHSALDRVRDIDIVARWGGEEMVVGLVGASEHDAALIADSIRTKIAETSIAHKRKHFTLTISAGVASFDHAENFDTLFEHADKAVYEAKERGRNRVVRWSEMTHHHKAQDH